MNSITALNDINLHPSIRLNPSLANMLEELLRELLANSSCVARINSKVDFDAMLKVRMLIVLLVLF